MEKELVQQIELIEFHPKTSICFISKGRVLNIPIDEISHISKYGYETMIYTANGNYRTYHSLQQIMNNLPVNDFFRIHKSHIISLKYMNGVKSKRIRVGKYYVPVSKYYKVQLLLAMRRILDRGYKTIALHETRIPIITPGYVAGY